MTRATVVDEKLNRLLMGQAPAEGDELAFELSRMIEQMDNAFPLPAVPEQVEDLHLARMMEVSGELSVPVTASIAPTHASFIDRLRVGLVPKVAAATLTCTAVFGGAAYAGVLPAPVQEAVSNAAALVGLDLPNPADDDADQDARDLDGSGDDYQPPDDAVDSRPDGQHSDRGAGSNEDGPESDLDDSDHQQDDGLADEGAASDNVDEPDGGDGSDTAEDGSDSDEPSGVEEPDSARSDSDEPDSAGSDSDEPSGVEEPDSADPDPDDLDGSAGSTDSDLGVDNEGASDL